MAKGSPIFSSFSSGEITPLLAARAETDAYKNGAAIMQNIVATSHGPAARRHGTILMNWDRDVIPAEPLVVDARIMDFSVTKALGTFVGVFLLDDGSTQIKPFSPNGKIVDPAIELVKNSSFDEGNTDWTDVSLETGAATFVNGQAILTAGASGQIFDYDANCVFVGSIGGDGEVYADVAVLNVSKIDDDGTDNSTELMYLAAGDTIEVVEANDASRNRFYTVTGPATDQGTYIDVPVTQTSSNKAPRLGNDAVVSWHVHVNGSQSAGIQQEVTGTVNGNNLTLNIFTQSDPNDSDTHVSVGTAAGLSDIYSGVYRGGELLEEFENTGGVSVFLTIYTETDSAVKTLDKVSMYDSTLTLPHDAEVIFDAPWTADELKYLQYDTPPEGNSLFISSPERAAYELSYAPDTQVWSFAIVTFVGAPAEWVDGSFPRAITFYQGRMWLGGTRDNPETFWASKSGTIKDFTQGDAADDSLEFTMDEHGEIEWIVGAKSLLIGTANGEHIVTAAEGVITPSDIQIEQQSAYGSRQVQAEKIGQDVLYISPDGRKVREIGYQWTDDGWISRDITFASEHITLGNSIKRFCFAQNPANLIWAVTDEGNLLGCTFEKTYSVIGWHQHTTGGKFIDCASVDINGTSVLGLISIRPINGVNRVFFEVKYEGAGGYMDCSKHVEYNPAVEVATGFEHLAGNTVDVMTDSGVHPQVEVAADGSIQLQWLASNVMAGHHMPATLRTLSPDMVGKEGATHGDTKGWYEIYVRIFESAKPMINGRRPPERSPATPMDTPEPMYTEDVQVGDLGYNTWTYIEIKQDLPLPLTILGVFGSLTRSSL